MNILGASRNTYLNGSQGASNDYKSFAYADVLTDDDKALVKAATGRDFSKNPPVGGDSKVVPILAMMISNSREDGDLKGPVTQRYLQQFIDDRGFKPGEISKALEFIRSSPESKSSKKHANALDVLG